MGRGRRAPSNTMSPEPRPTFVPSCIMVHQPFGQNRHGPKIAVGGIVSCRHLTQCGRPRPTCMHAKFHLDLSNRLATIHQRYRQDMTGPRSDSIRRTVLQTVAQKPRRHINAIAAKVHRRAVFCPEILTYTFIIL